MREIRIGGRNEIIASGVAAPVSAPPRVGGLAAIAATVLAMAVLVGIKTDSVQPPTVVVPVAALAAEPPIYDASGKVADRLDGAAAQAGEILPPLGVSSAALFGRWLARPAEAPLALAVAELSEDAPAPPALRRASARVAATPLPPARPASLDAVAVASVEPIREPSRIFGFVPADLIPSPRNALRKVASLGDALIERVTP